jgi:hypothetical protein
MAALSLEQKIRTQLIESGEKERLKQLLRRKLQECGWRDDIKERCRGALCSGASRAALRCERAAAPARSQLPRSPAARRPAGTLHAGQGVPPSLSAPSPPCPSSPARAEYVLKRGAEEVTVEEVIKAIRPEGRATVPDSIKAELLTHLKTFILSLQ